MRDTEEILAFLYTQIYDGPLSQSQLKKLKELKALRNEWLDKEEQAQCLKSRALWLKSNDNNTKYFHQFSKLRRNINSIREIKNAKGHLVISFKEKVENEASDFENLFKALVGHPIQEILNAVIKFP
jgi:hypothetical protein